MKRQSCKLCGSAFHTKFRCPQNQEAKQKHYDTMKRMQQNLSPSKPAKKKKPTLAQINKKIANGGTLTIAERKIQYNKQKDKAWKAFSDWVRMSECLSTTGTFERGICVTCNIAGRPDEFPYSKLQAGHAVGGRKNAVLFHEDIVHIQCQQCNRQGNGGLAGDYGNYMAYLVRKYGLDHAEGLQRLKNAYKEITHQDLIDIEKKYKDKLEELKCNNPQKALF